jgi:hypothetical protein
MGKEMLKKIVDDINNRLPKPESKHDHWWRIFLNARISDNGDLEVSGASHYGSLEYIFRYQNNNFELIYFSEQELPSGWGTAKHIDFLSKKKQSTAIIQVDDEETLEKKETPIKIDNLVRLADIKDFGEFNIDDFYAEME